MIFWSNQLPSELRGYPPSLAIAIASIAISTCLAANGLLAHSATVARNKLAEIVHTRRKLWAAIAQKENAEAAATARSEFIASASHEIRTPLHQLQGYSDLLSRTKLTDEGRLLLFAIQDATRTLSLSMCIALFYSERTLIMILVTSNVLDWSRLEKGEAISRPTSLDVRSVCESVILLLPNKDEDVDVELLVAISPEVPHSLFLDETYLNRIIMNLLSNALKFTATGYVLLQVYIRGNDLVFDITDTGCGIPDSFLPELFEPFKQAQTRGAHRGTGLGLSIVRQLLIKMGGTIELESRYRDAVDVGPENCGTTFIITIPIQFAPSNRSTPVHTPTSDRLALFTTQNTRLPEGLRQAWKMFGVEVTEVNEYSDLSPSFKYVWINAECLKRDRLLLRQLTDQDQWIVLVQYDVESILFELFGRIQPPSVVTVPTPLMWHQIFKSIENIGRKSSKAEPPGRMVRFASQVNVVEGLNHDGIHEAASASDLDQVRRLGTELEPEPPTVLLVEDNKVGSLSPFPIFDD